MHHIILNCDFTLQCWQKLLTKLNWVSALPRDLVNLFKCWPKTRGKNIYGKLWETISSHLIWEV